VSGVAVSGPVDPDQRHLLDYLAVVVRWRRMLIVGTLATAVVVAGISLVLPEKFTARTSLLPPDDDSGGLGLSMLGGSGVSGIPPGLAGLIGASTPSERLLTLLDSRRLLGLAVERHGLVERFEAPTRDHAIDQLALQIERELGGDGSLAIEVTAATPQLAADLANTTASLLDSLNREYRQRQARSTRSFLERRLASTRAEVAQDAEGLRRFQKQHGLVDVEAQTSAAVDVIKIVVGELSLLQVELGVAEETLSPDHPDRQLLGLKVEQLQKRLNLLVGEAATAADASPALGPPLQVLPDLMHEYGRLTLQLEVKQQILAFLSALLEEAKYGEARNTPTLQVLDEATPPHVRSFPRRAVLTVAGAGAALVLLTLLAFVFEAWERSRRSQQEGVQALRDAWRGDRGDS
jgi:tyrosine-protein kinase Etk/Wzc